MARTKGATSRIIYQCQVVEQSEDCSYTKIIDFTTFRQGAAAERWLNKFTDQLRFVDLFVDNANAGSLTYEPGDCAHLRSR